MVIKIILLMIYGVCSFTAFSQIVINVDDVKHHVGDSVRLTTKILGGRYYISEDPPETILYVEKVYFKAPLNLVIYDDVRDKLKNPPEEHYKNKLVSITGKIIIHLKRPSIIIRNIHQIEEIGDSHKK